MKKSFFLVLLLIGIFFVLTGLIVYFKVSGSALAAGAGDLDNVNLHIRTEASADHGAHWYNFSGTEEPGGQTVNVNSGELIDFRVKVWNDGIVDAHNVQIEGTVTNAQFVTALNITGTNPNGDANGFDNGFHFTGGGVGTNPLVAAGTDENVNYEGVTGTIQLADNFPAGLTTLTGEVNVNNYALIGYNPLMLFRRAFAQGVDRKSAVQIVINVAGGSGSSRAKPTPTPTSTPTPTIPANTEINSLPQTGADL